MLTTIALKPRPGFVATPRIEGLTERALAYVQAGYAVHFRGSAGTGKTTLALHVAARLGRPTVLLHGDDEFRSSDLAGSCDGFQRTRVVDNFIHSVLKTHESMERTWIDSRLTSACKQGFTLVYDEFTRSRPEANNVLLSILEERVLDVPGNSLQDYTKVHPEFCAIFTSNPEEYAGVHKTQDALLDRMISIQLDEVDREGEVAIVASRAGLDAENARRIVDVVAAFRAEAGAGRRPTLRGSIMIARLVRRMEVRVAASDALFAQIVKDVLDPGGRDADALVAKALGARPDPRRPRGRSSSPALSKGGKDGPS